MKSRSTGNVGPIRASELSKATRSEMARLKRAMNGPVDTSEIPERRHLKRHGPIWHSIAGEMRQQRQTGHGLWKLARAFCPQMPESAVFEFLSDKRSVRVEYADAMLQALGVRLTPSRKRRAVNR